MALALSMQTRTSGGSSDNEQNALTVHPAGSPSGLTVVITVTPVANRPSARRSNVASRPMAADAVDTAEPGDALPVIRRPGACGHETGRRLLAGRRPGPMP